MSSESSDELRYVVARYPSGVPVFTADELLATFMPEAVPPERAPSALQRALTASRSVKVRASGSSGSDAEHVSGYVDPSDMETARAGSASPASSPAGPAPEEKFRWEGASLPKLAAVIAVGLLIAFIPWKPAELTNQAWALFSIFVATIFGLILEPMPTSALAILSATVVLLTRTLEFPDLFSAFASSTTWLIVASFFFAKAFSLTGLGTRVANLFVWACGRTTLQLATGLVYAGLVLCPTMPSTSARHSGIFLPIVSSICERAESFPGPSASRLGKFMMMVMIQSSGPMTALFLSGAAPNLLCLELARGLGVNIPSPWIAWLSAASVPAFACIILCPLMVYKMVPPDLKDTPDAPSEAKQRLQESGPMTFKEWGLAATMVLCITLWVLSGVLAMPPVYAALLGLSILLVTGILKWKECLSYTPAWDMLIWFSILVAMSSQLTATGVTQYFTGQISAFMGQFTTSWVTTFYFLHAFYFLMHYLVASQTAHVAALYTAFLSLMIAAGVPPVLGALTLGFNNSLFGGITTFSSSQAAIYYGTGYLDLKEVFLVGGIMAVTYYIVFGTLGMLWWRMIGLY